MQIHFRTLHYVVLSMAFASVPLMLVGCGGRQHPESMTIPLAYQPERATTADFPPVNPSPALRLYIAPVVDARTNQDQVGENVERMDQMGARPIYATGPKPAQFVHDVVSEKLAEMGYHLVSDASQANRVLNLTLNRFYTVESSTYQGEVRATWQVDDANGQTLWRGQTATSSRRFGRSLSATNYNQSFSDATVRAVRDALQIDEFQQSLNVQ